MVHKKRVLVTGAAGSIASQVLPAFRERYDLVLLDTKATDRDGQPVDGVTVADVSDRDRRKYEGYFEGADAVVHLAYVHTNGDNVDKYFVESGNVDMAYNVYRAAYDAWVPRVVFASSCHAVDWYTKLLETRRIETLDLDVIPLSDQFYGWSKAAYEHLGFVFASGGLGRKMGVVLVRIGAPNDGKITNNRSPKGLKSYLGSYISPRDLAQLFVKSIDAPKIENEDGVPWLVVYGISNNTRAYWSLANARSFLGYEPEDDSESKFAHVVQEVLLGADDTERTGRLGVRSSE